MEIPESLRDLIMGLWGPGAAGAVRNCPAEESETDNWERARRLGFGEDSCVHASSYIYGDVRAGEHVWVGPFALLDASGGLEIGDYTMICAGVQVYSHDSVKWALTSGAAAIDKAPVKIGANCYIGAGAIVTRGVTIGDHTIVGAGAVVNRDLPPHSVAVGIPCKIVARAEISEDGEVRFARTAQPFPNRPDVTTM